MAPEIASFNFARRLPALPHKRHSGKSPEQISQRKQSARQGCEYSARVNSENQYLVGADSRRAGYFLR
jgi:hypothetical protein